MERLFEIIDELKKEYADLPKNTKACRLRCRKALLELSKSCKSCRQDLLKDMKELPVKKRDVKEDEPAAPEVVEAPAEVVAPVEKLVESGSKKKPKKGKR